MYNTPWHCTDVTHTNGHKLKFCRTQITTSCCVLYQLDSPERTIQFVVDFPLRLQDVSHISDNNSLPFCVKWLTRPQIILVRIFIHVYICIYVWSYIVFVLGLLCCIYRAYLCCIFVCNKAITFDGVMSHMNESCHIRKSHVSLPLLRICMQQGKHIWLSHVPYEWVMSRTKQSCQLTSATYLYANSGNHIWLSHVTYVWVSNVTNEGVTSADLCSISVNSANPGVDEAEINAHTHTQTYETHTNRTRTCTHAMKKSRRPVSVAYLSILWTLAWMRQKSTHTHTHKHT